MVEELSDERVVWLVRGDVVSGRQDKVEVVTLRSRGADGLRVGLLDGVSCAAEMHAIEVGAILRSQVHLEVLRSNRKRRRKYRPFPCKLTCGECSWIREKLLEIPQNGLLYRLARYPNPAVAPGRWAPHQRGDPGSSGAEFLSVIIGKIPDSKPPCSVTCSSLANRLE